MGDSPVLTSLLLETLPSTVTSLPPQPIRRKAFKTLRADDPNLEWNCHYDSGSVAKGKTLNIPLQGPPFREI